MTIMIMTTLSQQWQFPNNNDNDNNDNDNNDNDNNDNKDDNNDNDNTFPTMTISQQ